MKWRREENRGKERAWRKERKERKENGGGNRKGNKLREPFRPGLFWFVSAECIMLRVPRFLARRGHYERTKQRKSISIMRPSCRRDAAARINPFCVII